jgi:hypothetical protein
MPIKPNVEDQLQEFLAWQAEARREKKTIEAVYDEVRRVGGKQDKMLVALERAVADRLDDRLTIERHGRAIKTIQHQVEVLTGAIETVPTWRAPTEEQSGHHDVTALKKKLEEREKEERDETTWWRRQRWLWLVAAVMTAFAVGLGGCLTYTMKRIEALEKSLSHEPHPPPER